MSFIQDIYEHDETSQPYSNVRYFTLSYAYFYYIYHQSRKCVICIFCQKNIKNEELRLIIRFMLRQSMKGETQTLASKCSPMTSER